MSLSVCVQARHAKVPVWFAGIVSLMPDSKEGWFLAYAAGCMVHALSWPEPASFTPPAVFMPFPAPPSPRCASLASTLNKHTGPVGFL